MTKEEYTNKVKQKVEIMKAWLEGKTIQGSPVSCSEPRWFDIERPHFDFTITNFRIKPEPKPKTYRPWKPEEVPVGMLIRRKNMPNVRGLLLAVISNQCNDYTCVVFDRNQWSYKLLLDELEHSLDNGKTWLPCGVEVTESTEGDE